MGAWGAGPTENDTAADLAEDLGKKTVYEVVEEGLHSDDVDEQRYGAWLVTRLGYPFIYDNAKVKGHVKLALEKMRALLVDEEWIAEWDSKRKIRWAIRKQIDELTGLDIDSLQAETCGDE